MADTPNMVIGSPVTDLPSGQPANAPAGFPAAEAPTKNLPDLQVVEKKPPTAVIVNRPPTPWPVVLKDFKFEQLSTFLTAFELGTYRYIVRYWDLMRKRDEHLGSVSGKRFKRVSRLDWEIQPNDSSPEAIAQAEFLSDFMSDVHFKVAANSKEKFGLKKAFRHLLTAIANSYAGCEIEWFPGAGPNGEIRADLIRIRSDFFDESTGEMRLFTDMVSSEAIEIPADKVVIHRGDEALMIASSILFVMKQIALGQWNDFDERFGMPGLIGEAPDGSSTASKEALLSLLQNWGSKLAAVLPPGYKANFANALSGNGEIPAAKMVERCEDAMSVQWMGGNLTTKSQAGSGTLAGGAQRDSEIELTQDDAEALAETLTAQLCEPAVRFQFGQPLLCQFRFKIAQQVDLAGAIGVDVALVNSLGLEIAEADLRAKYGWRKPDADEVIIKPRTAPVQDNVPLPRPPSEIRQTSGDAGTALRASVSTVDTQTAEVVDQHAAAGRAAMKAMMDEIQGVIDGSLHLTAKQLETRLKDLQGKLPTARYEEVLFNLIESGFTQGSNGVAKIAAGGVH